MKSKTFKIHCLAAGSEGEQESPSDIAGHMCTGRGSLGSRIVINIKKFSTKFLMWDYRITELKTYWGSLLPVKNCVTAGKNNSDFRRRLRTKQKYLCKALNAMHE
jgi:hypothetical protein